MTIDTAIRNTQGLLLLRKSHRIYIASLNEVPMDDFMIFFKKSFPKKDQRNLAAKSSIPKRIFQKISSQESPKYLSGENLARI